MEMATDSFITTEEEIPTQEEEQEAQGPSLDDPPLEPVLTEQEIDQIHEAYNYWHMHGFPEKGAVLMECLNQGRRPPANLVMINPTEIKPEIPVASYEGLEIPARFGSAATAEAWREFAMLVTDMEPEIISKMGRTDLIKMLEIKEVIPTVEPPKGKSKKK